MTVIFGLYALLLLVGGIMGASKSPISLIAGLVGGVVSAAAAYLFTKNPQTALYIGIGGAVLMLGGMLPRFLKSYAVWPAGIIVTASVLVLIASVIALVGLRGQAAR